MTDRIVPRRALVSVSDKTGLVDFARSLIAAGVELFSTGGTRRELQAAGLEVRDVADYTGFPEMLAGRVKTLHPRVHGGILARRDVPSDMEALAEHGIESFELVVVNLYPFRETIAQAGVTRAEAIEQIDIGGPSMVRSAAKNHAFVAVCTSAKQYPDILADIAAGGLSTALRRRLAQEAFALTSENDAAIADYLASADREGDAKDELPATKSLQLTRQRSLRYGENPHQRAAVYVEGAAPAGSLLAAEVLHGKELSYNNLLDLDAALAVVQGLPGPAVSVIKHNNPCGAATSARLADATLEALDGDPLSAFGSIVAFNRPVDADSAEVMAEPGRFIEAIVAPDFEPAALHVLTTKPKWKANVRLLRLGAASQEGRIALRSIDGGYLVQDEDRGVEAPGDWLLKTMHEAPDVQEDDMLLAWETCRHVKSNAIVIARDGVVRGVGAGQMSRVDSVEIALKKAGDQAQGAVLASDAFFPFPDSIEAACAAGVTAFVQPGGSRKDDEVIAAANAHGAAMYFTGRRHFRH